MAKKKEIGTLTLAKATIPVDPVAMRRAAAILEVDVPTGDNADIALLGALRSQIQKLIKDKEHILCMVCDERSTEATPFCPFCGDEGDVVDEQQVQAAAAVAPEPEPEQPVTAEVVAAKDKGKAKATKPAKAKEAKLAVDVSADMQALATELDDCIERIAENTRKTIFATYDIGLLLKQINDRTLYRARGFDSFRKFVDQVLPVGRAMAYQLVGLVEQYDRKTFEEVGFKKLRVISALAGESHTEALAAARSGATHDQLEAMAKAKKRPALTSGSEKKPPSVAAPSPAAIGNNVTLLTKVDDKPREVTLVSLKTGQPLKSAGKVTFHVADAYGDIELAEGVHMRVGLRVVGKDITGFTVQYVRAAEAAE